MFIKIFLIASLSAIVFSASIFIYALAKGTLITPPDFRIPRFLSHFFFFKNSFLALMVSFLIILLYVASCFYLLIRFFENTQTSEIIFFTGFLIACMAEITRFIMICLGLWLSFSNILIFMGKVVLFGRTLAPLSFFCAAIFSETEYRQEIERNYIIMITVSIVFAAIIPMNTAKITSTALVTEGFMPLINASRFLILATAVFSFFVRGIQKNSMEHKHLASSSLVIIAGYSLLVTCDSYVFLILGTAGLVFGTYRYLKYLHNIYMWG